MPLHLNGPTRWEVEKGKDFKNESHLIGVFLNGPRGTPRFVSLGKWERQGRGKQGKWDAGGGVGRQKEMPGKEKEDRTKTKTVVLC